MDEMERFKQTFISECYELLTEMESLLLNLEETSYTSEELNAIFRCAHSIKGGAGAFGLDRLTSFTHVLENVLDQLREGKIKPTQELVNLLLKSVDILNAMVKSAEQNEPVVQTFGAELLASLETFAHHDGDITQHQQESMACEIQEVSYNISFVPSYGMLRTGNEPLFIIKELAKLGSLEMVTNISKLPKFNDIDPLACYFSWDMVLKTSSPLASIKEVFEFVEMECILNISKFEPKVKTSENQVYDEHKLEKTDTQSPRQSTSIRVEIEKVDRLVNMIGELVITQSMLNSVAKLLPSGQFSGLVRGIEELSQHTRDLQEAVMAVRMQPVKSVFSRMPRIVRDIASQLGKDIKIETYGENTELDKTVIEQLSDPLTHMIRNSADHGIEHPTERVKNGKKEQGVITLSATHRGGRIIIEIADDGAGIRRDKVLKKAKEQNIIAQDASLSNMEIDQLIMLPGFSTAETVSNISGRGVGMDVVRRNIESLGGTIDIMSEPDKGSVFTISLPLTLAILDGMIVRVGKENYIIPINNIIETLKPKLTDVKNLAGGSSVINVRGDYLGVLNLSHLFNISNSNHILNDSLIIIVENGNDKFGLIVDELLGQQQVVIKSLEANSDPIDGISGATILGDGKVSLILDVAKLQSIPNNSPTPATAVQHIKGE